MNNKKNKLIKEFNSSMAMGALKQINSDATELETMLQPNTQLEDWVKAKLNLAGEYLDDVYHHLDHFGSDGRQLDESWGVTDKESMFVATGKGKLIKDFEFVFDKKSELSEQILYFKNINEGWKDLVAASALGLSALKGFDSQAAPIKVSNQIQTDKPGVTQTVNKSKGLSDISLDQSFIDYIKRVENASKVGFNKQKNLWFPHKSFEGGSDTIGYGHKIQKGEDFSKGITDSQAEDLLKKDLEKAKAQVYKELNGQQLSKKQLEMFVDFVFNMGTLKKFPKFTAAALKNDTQSMKSQFKRFSGGKELKGRNSAFLQRFLTEYFGFNYYI